MKCTKQNLGYSIFTVIIFMVGIFLVLPSIVNIYSTQNVFAPTVFALGGDGGGVGGSGGDSGGDSGDGGGLGGDGGGVGGSGGDSGGDSGDGGGLGGDGGGVGGSGGDSGGDCCDSGDVGGGESDGGDHEPTPDPVLSCSDVSFDSSPNSPVVPGTSINLSWTFTGNVTSATIDSGIGDAFARNNVGIVINNTTTFNATISNAADTIVCPYTVTVQNVNNAPTCEFNATPTSLPIGGGDVTLTWETSNASLVSISSIGPVAKDNTIGEVVNVTDTVTYILTASKVGFAEVTCPVTITVGTPEGSLSCENNVTFESNDYSLPSGGGQAILTWTTSGVDAISINGVASTNLNDSETVTVNADTTYTMSIYDADGSVADTCPLVIDVASSGGGGGSSSPRCDFDISDEKIKNGEEVTLTWDTSSAREVKITDNHGNVLLDSEDRDDFDGEMTIKPTEDTEYTLLSKRGSRERECVVEVDVLSKVTVLSSRTQDPRVAGISLTQVPYTGFEAGPALTMIFYALLTIWGLFVAYVFAIRRDFIGGVSLAGAHDHVAFTDVSVDEAPEDAEAESKAESYVHAVAHTDAPVNLPTAAVAPIIGYAAAQEADKVDESIEMTELENRAHAQKVLLSSDAMRFFMNATEAGETRNEKLDATLAQAKASFPSEAGWVALNLARIETLISDDEAADEVETEVASITGGSLAEAIVSGNVVAAYQMIAHRPMIALADAAADLDAVYRSRKGEKVTVSDMLTASTKTLTVEQLETAIAALTGALDGTYESEASAVKMAIMKAVKATS